LVAQIEQEKALSLTDEIIHWGFGTKVKINLICMVGAALGILAMLFLKWSGFSGYFNSHHNDMYTWSFFDSLGWSPHPDLLFAGSLFIIGVVTSFVTPLGGAFQIAGSTLWYSGYASYLGVRDYGIHGYDVIYLDSGFWISIIGGVICILSIMAPIGFERPWKDLKLKERLLTFHRVR
jgi:hypothetical protein